MPRLSLPHPAVAPRDRSMKERRLVSIYFPAKAEWPGEDSSWLMSLSDLTLLLLCFLAVGYFSNKPKAGDAMVKPQAEVRLASQETEVEAQTVVDNVEAVNAASLEGWKVLGEEIAEHIEDLGLGKGAGVVSTRQGVVISLKDTFSFDSGNADLKPGYFPLIVKLAAITRADSEMTVEIQGHADDQPISTSEFPSNWELSAARASRIARYLVAKGLDPTRLSVRGYAHHRPLTPNSERENRQANRRVEIRLYREVERESVGP